MRNSRTAKPPRRRRCRLCRAWLNLSNRTGFCSRTVDCRRAGDRRRYRANPEPQRNRASRRLAEIYAEDPSACRAKSLAYYHAHRNERAEYRRRNAAKVRRWNRRGCAIYRSKKTAAKRKTTNRGEA